ncbi:MAG: diaminopimelate decarboxylase [Planctomycetota bacterium]|jgi:diaminopimelate decarboxylase
MTKKSNTPSYEAPKITPLDRPMTRRGPLDHRQGESPSLIAGFDPRAVLEEYGSPVVLYDAAKLKQTYADFVDAFKSRYEKMHVAYSVKTNYLSSLVALLYQEGAKMEVVSGFEYQVCRRLGIPGADITFNGPWKKNDELKEAFAQGSQVNLDNYDELLRAERIAKEVPGKKRIGLRVNMDVSYPPWDKFGFNLASGDAIAMVRRILDNDDFELAGLHMHVGTYIPNPDQYKKGAQALVDMALRIRDEFGVAPASLDMGGGYASSNTLRGQMLQGTATSPTPAMYAESLTEPLIKAKEKEGYEPELILEPGRALVDECGDILTTVVSVKPLRGGGRGAIIDAGVNILPTAYWYDHEISPLATEKRPAEKVKLFGPLCMQIDVVRPSVVLPAPKPGDVYAIRRVGAYNFSQSMQFIYARPNYLLAHEGQLHVIRKEETVEDALALESVPQDLMPKGNDN